MLKYFRSLYFAVAKTAATPFLGRPERLYRLADFLGDIRYRVGYIGRGRSRRTYIGLIRHALPERSEGDAAAVLRAFWRNHQKNFLELFLLPLLSPENINRFVDFEGLEHLDDALARGGGAVLAPPHFGNERLLHIALALRGYPLTVMTSAFADAPGNVRRARLAPARKLHELVFPTDDPRKLYRALARNRVVQFSPTAAGGSSGVWCDCFGRRLYISGAPARLAVRTGAPLLPAFIYRRSDNRHRLVVEPPLLSREGNTRVEAARLTCELMQIIERRVAEEPTQFYWMWLVIRAEETEAGRAHRRPKIKP